MNGRSLAALLGEPDERVRPTEDRNSGVATDERRRTISCGNGDNLGAVDEIAKLTWAQFCERIATPLRDEHTEKRFHSLPKEKRDAIKKRSGWYLAGKCQGKRRAKETIQFRTAVCLDIDGATPALLKAIEQGRTKLSRYAFVAHETHRSTNAKPRIRIVVWLATRIAPEQYRSIARAIAQMIVDDLAGVDEGCFEHFRLMYWPSRPVDSRYWCLKNEGAFLDPLDVVPADGRDLKSPAPKKVFRTDFDELSRAVRMTKNDDRFSEPGGSGRALWRDFISAIHYESGGSAEGRALAETWSDSWDGAQRDGEFEAVWNWAKPNPTNPVTGALILKYAKRDGYELPERFRRPDSDHNGVLFRMACDFRRSGKTFDQFNANWPTDREASASADRDTQNRKRTSKQRARFVERVWREASEEVGREGEHIVLSPAELNKNLARLDKTLANSSRDIFQRGDEVVFVRDSIEGTRDGEDIWAPQIVPMNVQQIQQEAMRAIKFCKFDARRGHTVPAECPESFAKHYLYKKEWRLRYLFGLLSHPTMRPDGSIVEKEGYDPDSGVFFAPSIKFPSVSRSPSKRDVQAAVDALRDVTRGFDFADDAAFAVWAACLMSVLLRPALPIAPIYGFDAPQAGSGKTKLATSISLIARGETVETMNQPPDAAEEEKRLFAAFRAGRRFILFDNCMRPLDGEHLCAIATSPKWGARILGVSKEQYFPTAVTIMCTGNQLAFRGDLASRAFVCRLAPRVENPRERRFNWSFEDECLERRGELVTAALTIARHYLVGTQPLEARTRFPEWDRMVRQPLIAAGLPDVCLTMQPEVDQEDRNTGTFRRVLKTWDAAFGDQPVRLKQLVNRAECAGAKGETLLALLEEIAPGEHDGEFDPVRLGRWLRDHRDLFAGGRVLRCQSDERNGSRWRVE